MDQYESLPVVTRPTMSSLATVTSIGTCVLWTLRLAEYSRYSDRIVGLLRNSKALLPTRIHLFMLSHVLLYRPCPPMKDSALARENQ